MSGTLTKDVETGQVHDFSSEDLEVTNCTRKVFPENEQFEFTVIDPNGDPQRLIIGGRLMIDIHHCLNAVGDLDEVTEVFIKLTPRNEKEMVVHHTHVRELPQTISEN